MLCDPGDAVLLANPYFPGFQRDIGARNGALCIGVDVGDDPTSPSTLDHLERKLVELAREGTKTRAVLLCNPANPLGASD
jgi:histidinol-phosphate/aromatic aminotransferase/cobyric acid decarboxylase-like protein